MDLSDYSRYLHVAAAVIVDLEGRVLIARRPDHLHQGGLWEFPGGKVEPNESVEAALHRELDEELGIAVERARPLIRIPYDYGDRQVLLDVWRVEAFSGEPHGREGQPVAWVESDGLGEFEFPAANRPIVTAAQLPDLCLVTPDPGPQGQWEAFLQRLEQRLESGIRLIQLRAKSLAEGDFRQLATKAAVLCERHRARLLLNAPARVTQTIPGAGLHLTTGALLSTTQRPLDAGRFISAACHDSQALEKALSIGVDMVFVSPVLPTASHPGAPTLGWDGLRLLCEKSGVPVFALGGLGPADRTRAWREGAQGVAAIRSLWGSST